MVASGELSYRVDSFSLGKADKKHGRVKSLELTKSSIKINNCWWFDSRDSPRQPRVKLAFFGVYAISPQRQVCLWYQSNTPCNVPRNAENNAFGSWAPGLRSSLSINLLFSGWGRQQNINRGEWMPLHFPSKRQRISSRSIGIVWKSKWNSDFPIIPVKTRKEE